MGTTFIPGLEGIVVSDTEISLLDTKEKMIVIRGHDLIELSKEKKYLDVLHLLLEGNLPSEDDLQAIMNRLSKNRAIPEELIQLFALLPKNAHPMDAQRTGISVLANFDEQIDDRSSVTNKQRAYTLLAQLPTLTVNSFRILNDQDVIGPRDDLSYSANFLYMITGEVPSKLEEEIFDKSLVLYSEHEMPNSTFTARVIASTNADLYGALTGAVASLKGNLHGGANEAVMYMFPEPNPAPALEDWLTRSPTKRERSRGLGQRAATKKMAPRE